MNIVFCKWFPFKGYKAITILKWIIVRKDVKVAFTSVDYNHECIHYEQEKELLYIGFYLLYVLEFLVSSSITASGIRHTGAYPLSVRHTQTSTTQRTP